jgi:hypothetical protein
MTTYLADGWFEAYGPKRLRNEVLAGALDSAGTLKQAGTTPQAVGLLARRVQALTMRLMGRHAAQLLPRPSDTQLSDEEREAVRQSLTLATDGDVALQALVLDCLDHVEHCADLSAFCLHLQHIAYLVRMLTQVHNDTALATATLGGALLNEAGEFTNLTRLRTADRASS